MNLDYHFRNLDSKTQSQITAKEGRGFDLFNGEFVNIWISNIYDSI